MEETDPRADIAFRRRCLTVNTGIYARGFGPTALVLLPEGSAVRRRFAAELDWMGSEPAWTSCDERRIAALCAEMLRHAHRAPEPLKDWWWHVARLRELIRQHEALVAVERRLSRVATWPSRPSPARGRRPPAGARGSGAADPPPPGLPGGLDPPQVRRTRRRIQSCSS